ncbi:MAG: hypothetical protein ACREDO_13115 [Methyloceanibacter sp.]
MLLAACLLGVALSGCSRKAEPPPGDFTLIDKSAKKPPDLQATGLELAKQACAEEAKKRGVKSVLAIFRGFGRGTSEEDYVDCMKERGYEPAR